MDNWKFADPKNTAVFTTRQVLAHGAPVLSVRHDDEDGAWQFLCTTTNNEEDGRMVGLDEIIRLDPTLEELCDLPLGWVAWRGAPGGPWSRAPQSDQD